MKILSNTSPYWLDDPRIARAERDGLARIVTSRPPDSLGLCPMTPIPIPDPSCMAADADGLGGLMLTPFPYLPRETTARYAMETNDAYRLRIVHTLHAAGALHDTDMGEPTIRPIPIPPDTPEETTARAQRFDLETREQAGFDENARRYRENLDQAWPDGYPLNDLLGMWHDLAPVIRGGCAVLAAHRALAMNGVDDKESVSLLEELRRDYPDVFTPKTMTPDGVWDWWERNVDMADIMADALLQLGFAGPEDAETIRGVAHEPRP